MSLIYSIGLEKQKANIANQKVHVTVLVVVHSGTELCAHNALPEMTEFGVEDALETESHFLLEWIE